jgi:hypothetical protein
MLALREHAAHRCARMNAEVRHAAGWPALSPGPASRFREGESAPLLALEGEALGARFRSWRGISGRRYIFSVYNRQSCPAYSDAIVIVAASHADGGRRVIFIADTGCFPEIAFAKALALADGEAEFHVHLLARSRAERQAVMDDLSQAPRS